MCGFFAQPASLIGFANRPLHNFAEAGGCRCVVRGDAFGLAAGELQGVAELGVAVAGGLGVGGHRGTIARTQVRSEIFDA